MNRFYSLIEPLNQWLNSLEKRERRVVIVGGLSLVPILFYLLIWEPITSSHEQQQLTYGSQKQLLNWMSNAASEIQSLNASGASTAARFQNQSISSLAERSATTTGIKPFITKIDQSKTGVKVSLKAASFDMMIDWLTVLQNTYAISASRVKIEPTKTAGSVDAEITLEREL